MKLLSLKSKQKRIAQQIENMQAMKSCDTNKLMKLADKLQQINLKIDNLEND